MKFALTSVAIGGLLLCAGPLFAQAPAKGAAPATPAATAAAPAATKGQTVRIAFMDPLSGPFANVGQNQLKSWQFVAERMSMKNPAGVKFEVVGFGGGGAPRGARGARGAASGRGGRDGT